MESIPSWQHLAASLLGWHGLLEHAVFYIMTLHFIEYAACLAYARHTVLTGRSVLMALHGWPYMLQFVRLHATEGSCTYHRVCVCYAAAELLRMAALVPDPPMHPRQCKCMCAFADCFDSTTGMLMHNLSPTDTVG